jgi:hypothetical protein
VNIEVTEGLNEGERVAVPQVKEQSLQMWGPGGNGGGRFGGNDDDESPSDSDSGAAVSQ